MATWDTAKPTVLHHSFSESGLDTAIVGWFSERRDDALDAQDVALLKDSVGVPQVSIPFGVDRAGTASGCAPMNGIGLGAPWERMRRAASGFFTR